METLSSVLAILFLITIILGIVGYKRGYIRFLGIKTRKQSLFLFLLAFVFFIGVGVTGESKTDSNKTASTPSITHPKETDTPKINSDDKVAITTVAATQTPKEQESTPTPQAVPVINGELKVHFIDVGQGASQLIIGSTGKTILIDAGNNNMSTRVVEYLKKEKVKKIDILISTHPDADHSGGLDAVISNFDIGKIYMPKVQSNTKTFEDVLKAIQNKGLKVATAKSGITLDWEKDAKVEMIAPIGSYDDANDMSAVVRLTYGETSFLFTGDAEAESEADLLKSGVNLKSNVLLVGHHGSETSTTKAFLDAVKPSYAVIQVGKNSYGHPTEMVLSRLNDKGVKIYRNDEQGNIIFTSNGKDVTTKQDNWKTNEVVDSKTESEASNEPTQTIKPTPTPIVEKPKNDEEVYYKNCTAVREAGAAPIKKGDPGYRKALDRDGDGIGCE